MKLLIFIFFVVTINLCAIDIDKIQDNEISYYRNSDNVCMPSTIAFKDSGLNSITKIKEFLKNSRISADMREEKGLIEFQLNNRYFLFSKGLDKCLEDRNMIFLHYPLAGNIKAKDISSSYFNYELKKIGICEKVKNPELMKTKQSEITLGNLDESKGIIIFFDGSVFTKTIDECLKI